MKALKNNWPKICLITLLWLGVMFWAGCASAIRVPWVYSDLTTVRDNGDTIVFAGRVICAPSDSLPFMVFHYELRNDPKERFFMKIHEDVHVRQSFRVGCVKHAIRYGSDEQYRFRAEFEAYCAEIQARVDAGFVKSVLIDNTSERIPYVYELQLTKEEVKRQLTYNCGGPNAGVSQIPRPDGKTSGEDYLDSLPELRWFPRWADSELSYLWQGQYAR